MEKLENTTTKYLKYAIWGCLYLVLPVALLLSSKFVFPFITLKTIYFRMLVEIALFLYLLLALSSPHYRPRMNKLIWSVLIFGIIVFVTGLLGVNPYRSFWGTIERGEGFLTISHLIAFFFILSQMIKSKRHWLDFLTAEVVVAFLVGFYALAQRFGAQWTIHPGEARLSSTLGNAAYLGAYALGNFWLSLLLFAQRKHIAWKIFFALSVLFEVYILFQTQTRAAMLAFLVTLFLVGFLFVFLSKNRHIKTAALITILIVVGTSSLIWLKKDIDWSNSKLPFGRLASISLSHTTVESRLYSWDSAMQGWQDHFLLGYGWENYNVAFNKYFHPEIYRDPGSQVWFDRAHNTLLDVAVASGLIGLISYLSIFVLSIFPLIFKKIKKTNTFYPSLILSAFLFAHFFQNIFVFDCLANYIMLFTVLGVVAYLLNKDDIYIERKDNQLKPINICAVIFGGIALVAAMTSFNITPAKANHLGLKALQYFYSSSAPQAAEYFKQAIDMHTYQTPELRQKYAENILTRYHNYDNLKTDQEKAMFASAILGLKQNMADEPYEARNQLYLMTIYNSFYASNATKMQENLEFGYDALNLSPDRQQVHFEMGRTYLSLGQVDKGVEHFKRAVDLNPKAFDPYWNLLSAYVITHQYDKAEELYQIMMPMGLEDSPDNLKRLSQIYSTTKYFPKLKEIYQKLIVKEPGNVDNWIRLAVVHRELGDYASAVGTARRILEINPEAEATVDEFLQTLK